MKKILLFMVLFIGILQVESVYAEQSIFIWEITEIEIEHGGDLGEALEIIKRGIKLKEGYEDPGFLIENDRINYTFQSVINTNIIKTYRLDHRVSSPLYRKKEIKSIFIHVVDNLPPKVISSQAITIPVKGAKPNYLLNIKYKDNVTKIDEIVVEVNDSHVDYNRIGSYEVIYTLIDEFGNSTIHLENVEIVDLIKPTITTTKELKHQVGTTFEIKDFFLIEDNYDDQVLIEYNFTGNIAEIGKVSISITATDSSGNKATKQADIDVVDEIPPEITLIQDRLTIDVETKELDLSEFVEVSDNYDDLTKDNLIVQNNIEFGTVGVYEVIFTIEDSSKNQATATLIIYVKDETPPTIYAEDLSLPQNSDYDLLENVYATDNYTKDNEIEIRLSQTDLNIEKPGKYYATYEAVDGSGNHAYETIMIEVEGKANKQFLFYGMIGLGALTSLGIVIFIFIKKRKNAF